MRHRPPASFALTPAADSHSLTTPLAAPRSKSFRSRRGCCESQTSPSPPPRSLVSVYMDRSSSPASRQSPALFHPRRCVAHPAPRQLPLSTAYSKIGEGACRLQPTVCPTIHAQNFLRRSLRLSTHRSHPR